MAVNTFGVDTDDIKAQVQNLSIRTDTSPSTSDVTESILFAAAEVERECAAVGISTSGLTDSADGTYLLLKKAIIYKVAGELLIGRNRGNKEDGEYYIERYDKIIETIRKTPQKIETDTTSGPDLAKFIDTDSQSFEGSAFYGSIPGKIIYGDSL